MEDREINVNVVVMKTFNSDYSRFGSTGKEKSAMSVVFNHLRPTSLT